MNPPEPFSFNAVLDGAYLDLPGDVLAAATAFVRRHGADDLLDMLGIGGAS